MTIGIEQFRDPRELGLHRMLLQPFRGDAGPLSAGREASGAMSMRRLLPRVALTLLLAAMAAWAFFHRDQINLATLDAWLHSLGPWAPIGYMMLFALATVAFVPGVVFSSCWGHILAAVAQHERELRAHQGSPCGGQAAREASRQSKLAQGCKTRGSGPEGECEAVRRQCPPDH
jgi:hypothetical protein